MWRWCNINNNLCPICGQIKLLYLNYSSVITDLSKRHKLQILKTILESLFTRAFDYLTFSQNILKIFTKKKAATAKILNH